MTLGQKLKKARTDAALSQEQLAKKLCVSRSAVAKWETDKGLPDVQNLKGLSQILQVSVDHLLDDGEAVDALVLREAYTLSDYGQGSRKKRKDRVVLSKFPDAQIHTLLGKLRPTTAERIVDNALGFLTDAPFGIPELVNSARHLDKEFYLVEQDGKQFLVTVTDEFIETHRLAGQSAGSKFEVGDWQFTKCTYPLSKAKE